MPDFPLASRLINKISVQTHSPEALGQALERVGGSFGVSTAWGTNNLAVYIPFEVYEPITVVKMSINNGSVVAGNADVGIYDFALNRRVSSGSVAQAGASAIQTFDITDTLLQAGMYYMALALSNTTATVAGWVSVTVPEGRMLGLAQQATAFPLPNPAVFAAYAQAFVPLISMSLKATI